MELHKSLGEDGEKSGIWFEYPLAFKEVKKKYKKYNKITILNI